MIIYGKNSVFEILKNNPTETKEILISETSKYIKDPNIRNVAQDYKIKLTLLSKESLSRICDTVKHQGIAAKVNEFKYSNIEQIYQKAKAKNILILILDHIEDPHNVGAIIRTAEFLGIEGIVIPKDRACDINSTVIKISSGAANQIKIAKETNLSRVIERLKKNGFWIIGADNSSDESLHNQKLDNLNLAVVIGNEHRGLNKKVKEKCDFIYSIPKRGKVDSLNASVAAGIFLYELSKMRTVG